MKPYELRRTKAICDERIWRRIPAPLLSKLASLAVNVLCMSEDIA